MDMEVVAPADTNASSFGEPGFEVRSPCGRAWFVPLSGVRADYIEFLKQCDGITEEEASAKVDEDPGFIETWFCEQFNWQDVERYGRQVKEPSAEDIKSALDFMRSYAGDGPVSDFTSHGVS